MQQREITLILSGGGARGIAHIAVIEALLKKGYVIRSISGTSMGALIGGVYAVGNLLILVFHHKGWLKVIEFLMKLNHLLLI